ncbi:NADH dehydrogenase [ubiquinone] 1 alpha subcomplex subunit 4-like 2 isoform X1 [Phasianus colchicus]|uniref:NADH dehydrogenase [ubiquinone] 1 alpha subcomplex subunit 4-like 2 isoform X1 n=1 Tax=Phasianus colchicus TaxID=9054 RepID=UPI00129DE344|nr:NADH dehydrogenase [ubiquinone] 1 alpha subcomplex subunit 4-like 2 isoform X1 [Phasianus colchicus]
MGSQSSSLCDGALVPLIGFISVGLGSAVLYLLRLALYSPDVSWDRKNNPEPWNKLGPTDQYKVSSGMDWGGGWALQGGAAPLTSLLFAVHSGFHRLQEPQEGAAQLLSSPPQSPLQPLPPLCTPCSHPSSYPLH